MQVQLIRVSPSFYLSISVLFTTAVTFGAGAKSSTKELASSGLPNFGTFGAWESCPEGTYAIGFQLKIEKKKGGFVRYGAGSSCSAKFIPGVDKSTVCKIKTRNDDSAVNAIRLFCGPIGTNIVSETITSKVRLSY